MTLPDPRPSSDESDELQAAASESAQAADSEAAAVLFEELAEASVPVEITVESRAHGWRIDHYLSRLFANHSRAQLQRRD